MNREPYGFPLVAEFVRILPGAGQLSQSGRRVQPPFPNAVTGPPLSSATVGWLDNHTVNGSTPSAIPLQSLVEAYSGSGFSTVEMTADNAGGSKPNTAEHPGTSPNGLDSTKGLLSAMGGMAAHPLQFTGPEMAGR